MMVRRRRRRRSGRGVVISGKKVGRPPSCQHPQAGGAKRSTSEEQNVVPFVCRPDGQLPVFLSRSDLR